MFEIAVQRARERRTDGTQLRAALERMRTENARLREENQLLRAALDAQVARAVPTPRYGSYELTAGTSVGPRRQREFRPPRTGGRTRSAPRGTRGQTT